YYEVKKEFVGDVFDEDVSPENWHKIFAEYYLRIQKALHEGKTVISDNSSPTKEGRQKLRSIGEKEHVFTKVIYVNTPKEIVTKRWIENKETQNRFDITEKTFQEALAEMEVPTADENVLIYFWKNNLSEWIEKNFKFLDKLE